MNLQAKAEEMLDVFLFLPRCFESKPISSSQNSLPSVTTEDVAPERPEA
jgi:hypothetical protein